MIPQYSQHAFVQVMRVCDMQCMSIGQQHLSVAIELATANQLNNNDIKHLLAFENAI